MKKFRTVCVAVVAAAVAAMLFALVGCSASAQESLTIGDASDGSVPVSLSNQTGKDIEAIYVKRAADSKYGAALAQSGLLASGATAQVNVPSAEAKKCDFKFETSDGAVYELCSLRPDHFKDAVLKVESSGTTCYLEYTDSETGEARSVLQSAQIAKKEAEAREKAEAEEKAAKEREKKAKKAAEEARKAAQQAATATTNSSEETTSGSTDYSSSGSGSSGASRKSSSSGSSSSSSSSKSSSSSSSKSSSKSAGSSSKSSSGGKSVTSGAGSSSGGSEDTRCVEL